MGKVFMITEGLENMGALRTGGQGSVYKGRRIGEIITAVKLLPTPIYAESKQDKNFRDFQSEVDKLKKVNEKPNPNVVKILSSGITESGSFPFIEMEFIEGPDLEELLKPPHDPVFSIREVIKVADQLANALSHCHSLGIKHGDIKSNNVKFNIHTGNYILLDFGLSIMSDEQRRTSLRHAGTIEFMAPEQNTGQILYQTDVYSYGIILYELLGGTVPFPLENDGETDRNNVMISHMEAPVPDLMTLRKERLPSNWTEAKKVREMQVPQWLLDIISKCLEKDPQKRFANGMELLETVVYKSTSVIEDAENNTGNVAVLQGENERLRNQILQYEEIENIAAERNFSKGREITGKRTSAIRISKPVFVALIILAVCLGVLSGYSFFSGQNNNYTASADTLLSDSSMVLPKDTVSMNVEKVSTRDIKPDIPGEQIVGKVKTSETKTDQKPAVSSKREKDAPKQKAKKNKGGKFIEVKFY